MLPPFPFFYISIIDLPILFPFSPFFCVTPFGVPVWRSQGSAMGPRPAWSAANAVGRSATEGRSSNTSAWKKTRMQTKRTGRRTMGMVSGVEGWKVQEEQPVLQQKSYRHGKIMLPYMVICVCFSDQWPYAHSRIVDYTRKYSGNNLFETTF